MVSASKSTGRMSSISIPVSSRTSRRIPSSGSSPGSNLPPGVCRVPGYAPPGLSWVMKRYEPLRSTSAITATFCIIDFWIKSRELRLPYHGGRCRGRTYDLADVPLPIFFRKVRGIAPIEGVINRTLLQYFFNGLDRGRTYDLADVNRTL